MSVRALSKVWECSSHSGTELLMLLAIADFADDAGRAYPSIATLAAKCRTKPRYAMVLLAALETSGELEIRKNAGPVGRGGRTNLYRIALDRLSASPQVVHPAAPLDHGEAVHRGAVVHPAAPVHPGSESSAPGFREVVNQGAPKPSLNRQEPEREPAARASAADRGTRLPTDWSLPNEWRTWARQERPDLDPDSTAERFADHWRAQPGAKGRKADWLATWRNWVRNERGPSAAIRGRASPLHADNPFDECSNR